MEDETCVPELDPVRLAAIADRTDWEKMEWFMTGWTKQQVAPPQNTELACWLRLARSSLPHSGYLVLPTATVNKHGFEAGSNCFIVLPVSQSSSSSLPRQMTRCVPLLHAMCGSEA